MDSSEKNKLKKKRQVSELHIGSSHTPSFLVQLGRKKKAAELLAGPSSFNNTVARRRPSSDHSSSSKSSVATSRHTLPTATGTSCDSAFFSDGTNSNSLSSTAAVKPVTRPISRQVSPALLPRLANTRCVFRRPSNTRNRRVCSPRHCPRPRRHRYRQHHGHDPTVDNERRLNTHHHRHRYPPRFIRTIRVFSSGVRPFAPFVTRARRHSARYRLAPTARTTRTTCTKPTSLSAIRRDASYRN